MDFESYENRVEGTGPAQDNDKGLLHAREDRIAHLKERLERCEGVAKSDFNTAAPQTQEEKPYFGGAVATREELQYLQKQQAERVSHLDLESGTREKQAPNINHDFNMAVYSEQDRREIESQDFAERFDTELENIFSSPPKQDKGMGY